MNCIRYTVIFLHRLTKLLSLIFVFILYLSRLKFLYNIFFLASIYILKLKICYNFSLEKPSLIHTGNVI